MSDYVDFLERKSQLGGNHGFAPVWMPDFLFDFQKSLVEWSCLKGRAAIFADCGLGKTPMQLVWAENVVRKTGGRVLILTPLAVSYQTIEEARKFGIPARRSINGELHDGINVTNYERLHMFRPEDFAGAVCDESSILKSYDGVRRSEITVFMRKLRYRLLCTATAAPNDYIELGTSSEALGYLGHMDMLGRFFKHVDGATAARGHDSFRFKHKEKAILLKETGSLWRFKGHAEIPFWRWVCSWARAVRRPSDLGFSDDGFILPPLREAEHSVDARSLADGMLFALPAVGLKEQREEHRRTIDERCETVASIVNGKPHPALVWCHLNEEGNRLAKLIPDAVQVSGADTDEEKEEKFLSFAHGQSRVLVTKPKIGAWGLNFQHCSHITFFPSHSFEQYYQGIRRCWRFGQKRPVSVDIITTDGDAGILANLKRKATQADEMFSNLVAQMQNVLHINRPAAFTETEEVPSWLLQRSA